MLFYKCRIKINSAKFLKIFFRKYLSFVYFNFKYQYLMDSKSPSPDRSENPYESRFF